MTLAIEPKDLILAIPAFSGMVLGIYNFFNERAKRKIKETLIYSDVTTLRRRCV